MTRTQTTALDELVREYVELALAMDGSEASYRILSAMVDLGLDITTVFDAVLAPASERIGDLWHAGAISVADEHYATNVTRSLLGFVMFRNPPKPRPADGPVAILACPQEESHDLGLVMAGHVLAHEGLDVRVLGARTPARDLAAAVEEAGATVLGLSIVTPLAIASAVEAVDETRRRVPDVKVLAGGRCLREYPKVASTLRAEWTCTRLADVPGLVERLL